MIDKERKFKKYSENEKKTQSEKANVDRCSIKQNKQRTHRQKKCERLKRR